MFKNLTFRSDGAFWPFTERSDFAAQGSATLFARLRALLRRLGAELAARRATHTLASLDDRTLRDIGIERDQIWHAVRYGREAVHGEAFDVARWS
jgi:uncharacterized protein YjiS (DUF1127 family)